MHILNYMLLIFVIFFNVAVPVWFYWSMTIWPNFDGSACLNGFLLWDFINLLIIYGTVWSVSCISGTSVLGLVLCLPCVLYYLPSYVRRYLQNQQNDHEQEDVAYLLSEGAMSKLFTPSEGTKECAICIENFE